MENEANGLKDSFVARHTTDPTLRFELLSRHQNGSSHDQDSVMEGEVRKTKDSIALRWGEGHWYCFSGTTWRVCRDRKGVVKVIHQNWSWGRSFNWLRNKNWKKLWDRMIQQIWLHKLSEKLVPSVTKRYFREFQNKLTKIVVIFVVKAAS